MNSSYDIESSTCRNPMSSSTGENDAEIKSLTWNLSEKRFRSCHRRCSEFGDFNIVRTTLQIADAHLRQEDYDKALMKYEVISQTPTNISHEVRARACHGIGVVHMRKHEVGLSRLAFESSIKHLSLSDSGRCSLNIAESYYCLGLVLRTSCREADKDVCLRSFLSALEVRRYVLGCDNLLVAETLTIIGTMHLERNEQVEAYQAFSEAKRIEILNGRMQTPFDPRIGKKSFSCSPRRRSIAARDSNDSWMFAASAA
mmetsp:Transcript_2795/g.3264  ORF Transcript_2795/g.3264 Transcript_2795/m.3264 type:complete len:257 (+) Transcript_2795:81-851(+)